LSKIMRHALVLLAAAPILLGLLASSFAAPCAHAPDGRPDRSTCPCCEKTVLAATCGLACHAGIEADAREIRPRLELRRIAFGVLAQQAGGIDIAPPLPPPRSMGTS
jgi:hypothetical protein